jgi:acyl carrier protein
MEQRIKQIMADVLDLDCDSIDESTERDAVESWDSLQHIQLCLGLEQEFQISLGVDEIESMLSYADILQVLRGKLKALSERSQ